MYIINMHHWSK